VTINNAATAIASIWNWGMWPLNLCYDDSLNRFSGWTFQGVTINNCQVGFDLTTGGLTQATQASPTYHAYLGTHLLAQTVGAEAIIDAVVSNTPIFVRDSTASNGKLAGSLVLNNIKLTNVPTAVGVSGGAVVLSGGTTTIASWGQGNVYKGTNSSPTFTQGSIPAANKPSVLLDSAGRIFGKTHPQYAAYATSQFVSVRDQGAKGDGSTGGSSSTR
jgi:glucan 1,3-beta-glucosidase